MLFIFIIYIRQEQVDNGLLNYLLKYYSVI